MFVYAPRNLFIDLKQQPNENLKPYEYFNLGS